MDLLIDTHFDRIIIAQAIHENLSIISKDEQFKNYEVPLIWKNSQYPIAYKYAEIIRTIT